MKVIRIFIFLSFISAVILGAAEYNIKDYGAKGTGIVLDTKTIQTTINKAHNAGGGVVVLPSGTYKIGTLVLKDNVNLHLQAGATLLGSPNIKDYIEVHQKLESRTNKLYAKYFLIYAEDAKNISITGQGTINGNGADNFQVVRPQNMRPYLMRLVNCENVTIRDVQLLESANWTFHLLGCKDVTIDGIKIINTTKGGNRDGLDIDACKNVTVSNCKISSMDDAIVLKSTNNITCENISITNCILSSDASAFKTGTESNGGFKNITFSNSVIKNVPIHSGIELMTVDGGNLENITISNIVMDSVATPIFVYLGNRARPFKKGQYVKKVSDVNDIYFNNIIVTNAKLPSGVIGLNNAKVKNVSFNNISIRYSETIEGEALAVNKVPYKDLSYPMAIMHGKNLPACAFYCRNAEDLSYYNVTVFSANKEKRPSFVFDKINNLELYSVKCVNNTNAMFYLRNTNNVYSTLCRTINKSEALFKMEKQNCGNINSVNNYLYGNQKEIVEVKALPEMELLVDINPEEKFDIRNGKIIDGLIAQKISEEPLNVEFKITKNVTSQICLLIKNSTTKPEKVKIKYNGTEQEFMVDWNKWGWAPIILVRQFDKSKNVSFRIEPVNKNSGLIVSKVLLKNLKLGYTD